MPQVKRKLGLIPQGPDARDIPAKVPEDFLRALPPRKFKITQLPKPFDQGSLGSCTANMILGMVQYLRNRQGLSQKIFSRLAQYYWTRVVMGTVNSDSGASIRDTFKTMNKQGAAVEALWPYLVSKFKEKPNAATVADAAKRKTIGYGAVDQTEIAVKTQIAAGNPVGFGFAVWSSFYNIGKDGLMKMPDVARERIEGYHAVYAYGYDDDEQMVYIRNSWGSGWGLGGDFKMPYKFFFDRAMTFDHWTAWLTAQVD